MPLGNLSSYSTDLLIILGKLIKSGREVGKVGKGYGVRGGGMIIMLRHCTGASVFNGEHQLKLIDRLGYS